VLIIDKNVSVELCDENRGFGIFDGARKSVLKELPKKIAEKMAGGVDVRLLSEFGVAYPIARALIGTGATYLIENKYIAEMGRPKMQSEPLIRGRRTKRSMKLHGRSCVLLFGSDEVMQKGGQKAFGNNLKSTRSLVRTVPALLRIGALSPITIEARLLQSEFSESE
jgi:hypothetical protein